MFKKIVLLTVIVLSGLAPSSSKAFWQSDITMLIVPREAIPLQIAQDISRRYPVLLVSYQVTRGTLKTHAWDGDNWVSVPTNDYASGTFFANRPAHAILVEYDRIRAPQILIPNSTWCKSVSRITSTDPRVMLHLLGLYFNFPFRYWDQFATRYNYPIEEINPTLSNVHWWNMRGDVLAEKRAKRNFSIDLNKWQCIDPLPPPPIESVIIEEPKYIPEIETPAAEPVKVIRVNAPDPLPEKTPVTKPVPVVMPIPAITPPASIPALKPAPSTSPFPSLKPEPVIEKAPAVEPVPAPLMEPPAAKSPAQFVELAPAPLIESPVASTPEPEKILENNNPPSEPPVMMEADPFSTEEIPAAEIVIPPAPKKPWWKKL